MTTETINYNYKQFADRIIEMIFENNMRYDHVSFQNTGNKLGREIYAVGGANGLFSVMRVVEQELLDYEYSNSYLGKLRELEVSWHGICDEWQM
jgi:hypothetical protein